MQTYTHLVLGALLGKFFFPDSSLGQTSCATCAILPDLVMVPRFILDKLSGRKPLKSQSSLLLKAKEGSHSLVLWGIVGTLSFFTENRALEIALVAGCLGGISHVLIDILTHRDEKYRENEPTYLWPLPASLQGLAIYEYRIDNGVLRPKGPEAAVIVITIIFYAILWIV